MTQEKLERLDDIRRMRKDINYEIDAMRPKANVIKEDTTGRFTMRISNERDNVVFYCSVPREYVVNVFKKRWNKLHEVLAQIDKEIEEL